MSIWHKNIESVGGKDDKCVANQEASSRDASRYAFIDVEVGVKDKKVHDIGAVRWDGAVFHSANKRALMEFVDEVDYICGHNIVHHDAKFLFGEENTQWTFVDTLYVSPLLFPERPYHRLLKDDKLASEQTNNPVNDSEKARELLMDEVAKWNMLTNNKKAIFTTLLHNVTEFAGFVEFVGAAPDIDLSQIQRVVLDTFKGKICEHANIMTLAYRQPVELAYALSLIDTTDHRSITPPWVLHNYPNVENIVRLLRHTRCEKGCEYCNSHLDIHNNLKLFFGYDQFRTYEGEPLQENAVRSAVDNKSLLAIFPTGGGKSLTFQLPALMEGRTVHGLTVVISPLLSLMKDQVDNLAERGIADAVSINGMLDPIGRSLAIQRVQEGDASLLYIAPEMLRSKTIEKLLLSRHVVRFVIDEAHCFSSWGQDFRVDYLYIGKFIDEYQKKKQYTNAIPVSCFTATAKQKVVQDICDYFKQTLNIDLELYASTASRTNLHYSVIHTDNDDDKYQKLRSLIAESSCPAIVYVSRTKRTRQLAERLTRDGHKALPFNGQMDADEKVANQEAFMNDQVRIIVATSAFGMGVDKSDVGLVVHYDISDSLENYVQEAGRAGRDPHLEARCFVLYSDTDLDKHFILLNQTKLSLSEIQQVWKAVKEITKQRPSACCSALEIARAAGWDNATVDIETRVKTALAALEQAGYIVRENNVPHVYATGITVKNIDEARKLIAESPLFENKEVEKAVRIIKSLITQKHVAKSRDADAESRVDYLADMLGLNKSEVVSAIERMRQEGILADTKDISAYLHDKGDSEKDARRLLERFTKLERYLLNVIPDETLKISCKQLNDNAQKAGVDTATEKDIRTLLFFLSVKGYIRKKEDAAHNIEVWRQTNIQATHERFEKRLEICRFAIRWLYRQAERTTQKASKKNGILFSIIELLNDLKAQGQDLFGLLQDVQLKDLEEALLYLSTIGSLKLEGGFLVIYNALSIRRIKDSKLRYKQEDYRMLNEFYKQKIQQVHIVGEYANLMVRDYDAALQYVQDYFQIDYRRFVSKYFKGDRLHEIERNISPEKYQQLFGKLSKKQMEIISDKESHCIVVAAGPGSGKTRVLVHKLASLLMLEDVKHEQLLMLTFSRAAAIEFKQRLMELVGNAAHFVEIKTFHSYCFDLLGRMGNLDEAKDVVSHAAQMISAGEVERSRIAKTVLVVDEAQDMSADEYALIQALMTANEEIRVIAVGDDDQNIFEFRGSNSQYMSRLLHDSAGRFVEMTENYRSTRHVVDFANAFVKSISMRMKTTPITSVGLDDGYISVTHHASACMYTPLVQDIMQHRKKGTTCILTQTNEEAAILVALLRQHGLNSKLIQSIEGFRFWNMAEVRLFLKYLDAKTHTPTIAEEVWEEAKQKTYTAYSTSESLPLLQRCVEIFEQTNKVKYLTDFKELVYESTAEDFCNLTDADIVVSTIHKSKGKEYDNVYMLITAFDKPLTTSVDEVLRRYYVGMTRAKQPLFIHTNTSLFDILPADQHAIDQHQYEMPDKIVLQLSHKDVNLGFFKTRKSRVLDLRSGEQLNFANNCLYSPKTNLAVAQLSQKMQADLLAWNKKGYNISSASVRFIVAWRPKEATKEEKEQAVLLVDIELTKESRLQDKQS